MRGRSSTAELLKEVKLNGFHQYALSLDGLGALGLTGEHLRGKDWFNSDEHVQALCQLMQTQKLRPEKALRVLDGTSDLQAKAIKRNIPRKETESLNDFQLRALIKLRDKKIKRADLIDKPWFNSEYHYKALLLMVKNRGRSIADALNSLKNLDENQAGALCDGMDFGLTHQHVAGQAWIQTKEAAAALVCLVKNKQDPACAIEVLRGIGDAWKYQAIASGADAEEVALLQNAFQLKALNALRDFGVQANDFVNQEWFNSEDHFQLLQYKVQETCRKLNVLISKTIKCIDQAADIRSEGCGVDEIDRIFQQAAEERKQATDQTQAMKRDVVGRMLENLSGIQPHHAKLMFIKRKYTREDVIHLNEFQVRALLEIKHPALHASDVVGQDWLNSEERFKVFRYMLNDRRVILDRSGTLLPKVMGELAQWSDEQFNEVLNLPIDAYKCMEKLEVSLMLVEVNNPLQDDKHKCQIL